MNWKTISSTTQLDTSYIKVQKNIVELPSGVIINDYYTASVQDSTTVVALTSKKEIILIKQYRYCYDAELIELPSGVFEDSEMDPIVVAKRELLEETGYRSDKWTYLGATIENPAKLRNHNHLFLAKNCEKISDQKLDATERIDVLILPLKKSVDMVMNNLICCNTAAHAILKVARLICEGER